MNILTLTLNPSIDLILTLKKFVPHEKNILEGKQIFYGGKGVNVAFTLGKLGLNVTAAGLVGKNEKEAFDRKLENVHVRPAFTPVDSSTRYAFKVMETADNRDTEFNQRGEALNKRDLKRFFSEIDPLIRSHDWFIMSGSIPQGVPVEIYSDLIQTAREMQVHTTLDTSGKALLEGIKATPEVLRINCAELGELFPNMGTQTSDILKAMKELHTEGIGKVVISMGGEGTLGFDSNESLQVCIPKVNIRSLTGAGDAMTAALVASLAQGKTFRESLRFSSALATASTLRMEPGDFDQNDLENILRETTLKDISY